MNKRKFRSTSFHRVCSKGGRPNDVHSRVAYGAFAQSRGFEPRCTLTENCASQVNLCNVYGHLFRDGSYTRESGKGRGWLQGLYLVKSKRLCYVAAIRAFGPCMYIYSLTRHSLKCPNAFISLLPASEPRACFFFVILIFGNFVRTGFALNSLPRL